LTPDWRGDNAGPPTAAEVRTHFAAIAREFPGAAVHASTFEEWADTLDVVSDNALPQISSEIGDRLLFSYSCYLFYADR
jgi:hypothetical protein